MVFSVITQSLGKSISLYVDGIQGVMYVTHPSCGECGAAGKEVKECLPRFKKKAVRRLIEGILTALFVLLCFTPACHSSWKEKVILPFFMVLSWSSISEKVTIRSLF